MRFRFFLCASADLGVRRTKVSSSFCRSGYIMVSEESQAADCAAIRFVTGRQGPARIKLELKFYSKLHQSRITHLIDLSELRTIREITVGIEKLRVIEDVEELSSEVNLLAF